MNFTDITIGAVLSRVGGSAIGRADRDRGNDRGPAEDVADHRGLRMRDRLRSRPVR